MQRFAETFLAAVQYVRTATVEIDAASESAGVRIGDRPLAHIDLRHGRVAVDAPANVIPTLQRLFPSSRPATGGIVFDLADPRARPEALAAIRRRANVERLVGQALEASP